MIINTGTLNALRNMLGPDQANEAAYLATQATILEKQLAGNIKRAMDKALLRLLADATKLQMLPFHDIDFTPVVMSNARTAMEFGIRSTFTQRAIRLAALPPDQVPKSLAGLRKWWDHYRRMGEVPPRQAAHAKLIRDAFLTEIQRAWRTASSDFLSGNAFAQEAARDFITKRAGVGFSRAKMITETETTHYYNSARREIYDASDDVLGYLFLAIRDHRTTKWCSTRHGLVYLKKDMALLDLETPPIHWYCRSEMVPLVAWNVRHMALLADPRRLRINHRCEPLPAEWTGRQRTS